MLSALTSSAVMSGNRKAPAMPGVCTVCTLNVNISIGIGRFFSDASKVQFVLALVL